MDKFLEDTLKANAEESMKEMNARRTKEGRRIERRITKVRSWLATNKKWTNRNKRDEGAPLTADMRKELITESKALERKRRGTPSLEFRSTIGYVRYADDYLVALQKHSKAEAEEVRRKIAEFLKAHLQLEQSEEKTLITHPRDTIKFLGYDLTSSGGRKKGLRLSIPRKAIRGTLSEIERLGKLHHIPEADLFTKVNAILRGWRNYYRFAMAPQRTFEYMQYKVFWLVSHYLASKNRTTIPVILKRYGATVTRNGRTRQTLRKWVMEKPIDLDVFPPRSANIFQVKYGKQLIDDVKPVTVQEWATGRSIEDRIQALEAADYQCSYCGTTEDVQVHHTGGLRGLQTAKQKSMAGQAKERIPLCRSCHIEVGHHGSFAPRNQGISAA